VNWTHVRRRNSLSFGITRSAQRGRKPQYRLRRHLAKNGVVECSRLPWTSSRAGASCAFHLRPIIGASLPTCNILSQIAVGGVLPHVPSSFLAITDDVIASRGHCAAGGAAISLPLLRASTFATRCSRARTDQERPAAAAGVFIAWAEGACCSLRPQRPAVALPSLDKHKKGPDYPGG